MSIINFSAALTPKIVKLITQTNAMDTDTKRNVTKSRITDVGMNQTIAKERQNQFVDTSQSGLAKLCLN